MTDKLFALALGEIDEKYLIEAINYKKSEKVVRNVWKAAVASVAVLALVIGIFSMLRQGVGAPPSVLTAYASENDRIVPYMMEEGKEVPISRFETITGLSGFVFAYDTDPKSYETFSIMSEGEVTGEAEEHIRGISGLGREKGKHYIYYVPDRSKTAPYRFMIPYTDEEANKVYLCNLLVEETESGYTAVIEVLQQHERSFKE